MTDFTNFKDELGRYIENSDKVIITAHLSPDPDSISSCLLMKEVLEKYYGKNSRIVIDKDIKDNYRMLNNFEDLEYGDPGEYVDENTTLIILDVNEYRRFTRKVSNLKKTKFLICIDHHEVEPDKFNLYLNYNSSSLVELIYYIWGEDISVDKETAENIWLGMIDDNGNFLYGMSEMTYLVAYRLTRDFDIDTTTLQSKLFSIDEKGVGVLRAMLDNYEVVDKLAFVYITDKQASPYSKNDISKAKELITKKIAHYLSGIEILAIIYPISEDNYRTRLIGKTRETRVNKIAEKFGGGGHEMGAGANFKGDIEDFKKELILAYKELN